MSYSSAGQRALHRRAGVVADGLQKTYAARQADHAMTCLGESIGKVAADSLAGAGYQKVRGDMEDSVNKEWGMVV